MLISASCGIYTGPAAALIRQHSPFWVVIAICVREDTYRGQIQHWHHPWSSFDYDTPWAWEHQVLPHSKLLKLSGCFWSKPRSLPGWAQKMAVNMCDSNAPWPQQWLHHDRRQSFTWQRDAVCGLSSDHCLPTRWLHTQDLSVTSMAPFPLIPQNRLTSAFLFKLMFNSFQELFSFFPTLREFWYCLCWEQDEESIKIRSV